MNKTKDAITKICSFSQVFKTKNNFRDNFVDFLPKKLTLKNENGQFLTALNQIVLQDIKESLSEADLDTKIY